MPTTLRLSRAGTHNRPYYHIVATNSRSPRDSKFIERLGSYDPLLASGDPKRVTINAERAKHWLSVGAQMSDRVHLFFNQAGIVTTKPAQRPARKSKKDKGEAESAPAAEAAAAPADVSGEASAKPEAPKEEAAPAADDAAPAA